MTRYQVQREETSVNLTNISEQVYVNVIWSDVTDLSRSGQCSVPIVSI